MKHLKYYNIFELHSDTYLSAKNKALDLYKIKKAKEFDKMQRLRKAQEEYDDNTNRDNIFNDDLYHAITINDEPDFNKYILNRNIKKQYFYDYVYLQVDSRYISSINIITVENNELVAFHNHIIPDEIKLMRSQLKNYMSENESIILNSENGIDLIFQIKKNHPSLSIFEIMDEAAQRMV